MTTTEYVNLTDPFISFAW